jgi:uncharacterized protein
LRELSTIDDILALIADDPWRMQVLRTARQLALPDWWIGAGFVRALVWDQLHGFVQPTRLADIDVLYFDQSSLDEKIEKEQEARLATLMPEIPWSVKNQARMHLSNGDAPYSSTEDALQYWLETPTAVAVKLDARDRLDMIAPYGAEDLLALKIRPTASGRQRPDEFLGRVTDKGWLASWPQAKLVID